MKTKLKFLIFILLGVTIGVFLPEILKTSTSSKNILVADIYDLQDKVISITEQASKAAVGISVTSIVRPYYSQDPYQNEMFKFFFGMPEREFRQSGIGSGFIVNEDGYILTNEHVINGADEIKVILPDGRKYIAELTGYDIRSDLAVLKIEEKGLPYIELGDSDKVRPGQWAIALGNPFAIFENSPTPTVTQGIISAIHRSLPSSDMKNRYYGDLIQTDAAINPGNSGGPLLDIDGKVIGINVAILSRSGQSAGVGFALPINRAKRILDRLIEGKEIRYGWLGVAVQNLSPDLMRNFNLDRNTGVLVAQVLPDGPAGEAGIKRRDIITKFDTHRIESVNQLIDLVTRSEAGKAVKVEVIRNNKIKKLKVLIGESAKTQNRIEQESEKKIVTWRGIAVCGLTIALQDRYEIEDVDGVVVIGVKPNSPGAFAKVAEGDIIDEVNRERVDNMDDFLKKIETAEGNILVHTYNQGYVIIRDYDRSE